MSQAEDLLDSLSEEESSYFAGTSPNERHIAIGKDRFITVPEELKKIAVQGDNNIETVTFDCPRYWDEHDLSLMDIYVHYRRADGKADKHQCSNIVVDETDDTIMHFDWEVARQAVRVMGNLTILVCIKDVDQDIYWYSELNNDLCISEGLEPDGEIAEEYSDILEQWKEEVLAAKDVSSEEIESAVKDYMEANPYKETDPTVPDWAKQSTKPTYTAEEVGALPSTTKIPTKTSDLENTNGFITASVSNLVNYYKKTETYTQDEINQLISLIPKFSIKVVAELPTSDISETTVYLVPYGEESENLYTEYIYVNSAWEILGTQSVDLSGYAKTSELPSTLPNPKALTFTGGVTGTYDGSEAKNIQIPKFIDPVAKTDEMTQEVGVDEAGGLFTSVGKITPRELELIIDFTVEEQAISYIFTKEQYPQIENLTFIYVEIDQQADAENTRWAQMMINNAKPIINWSSSQRVLVGYASASEGFWIQHSKNSTNTVYINASFMDGLFLSGIKTMVKYEKLYRITINSWEAVFLNVGTTIKIYGC